MLLVLGFVTPLASAAIIGVMVNAIVAVHLRKGPWATNGGWELPIIDAAVAAAFAFAGPGRHSLDSALGWTLAGQGWGLAALVIGVGAAAITLGLSAALLGRAQTGSTRQQAV